MSDYMSSLVERSFGQATVVKPRPAPLFAPAPHVTGALAQATAPALVTDLPLESSRRAGLAAEAQPIFAAGQPPVQGASPSLSPGLALADKKNGPPRNAPLGPRIEPMAPETSFVRSGQSTEPATPELTQAMLMHTRRHSDATGKAHTEPPPEQASPPERALSQVKRHFTAQDPSVPVSDNMSAAALESARWQPAPAEAPRTARADQSADVRLAPGQRAAHQKPGSHAPTAFQDEGDRSEYLAERPSGQDVANGYHFERTGSTISPALKPLRPATVQPTRSLASIGMQEPTVGSQGDAKPAQPARRVTADDLTADSERSLLRPVLRVAHQKPSEELWPAAGRPSASAGADDIAAPAQPAIHVTIGRIEVRATPPPAPVMQKRPTSQAMSLDDYLKLRKGGQL